MPRFPTTIPTLFIIGGAEDRVGKASLLRQFVKLSGGRRSQIVLIPTAYTFLLLILDTLLFFYPFCGFNASRVKRGGRRARLLSLLLLLARSIFLLLY